MSVTLRYPDGTRDTFNRAANVRYRNNGVCELVDEKNRWSATVPPAANVVIEAVEPCAIEAGDAPTVQRALTTLLGSKKQLRRADWLTVRRLKRELAKFNAHTGEWKK